MLSPVVFALFAAIHVNVEGMLDVNGIFTVLPLQMAALLVLVTTGVGLTVTVTVCGVPAQLPEVEVGVTV